MEHEALRNFNWATIEVNSGVINTDQRNRRQSDFIPTHHKARLALNLSLATRSVLQGGRGGISVKHDICYSARIARCAFYFQVCRQS
jgi:hypothetical protein